MGPGTDVRRSSRAGLTEKGKSEDGPQQSQIKSFDRSATEALDMVLAGADLESLPHEHEHELEHGHQAHEDEESSPSSPKQKTRTSSPRKVAPKNVPEWARVLLFLEPVMQTCEEIKVDLPLPKPPPSVTPHPMVLDAALKTLTDCTVCAIPRAKTEGKKYF